MHTNNKKNRSSHLFIDLLMGLFWLFFFLFFLGQGVIITSDINLFEFPHRCYSLRFWSPFFFLLLEDNPNANIDQFVQSKQFCILLFFGWTKTHQTHHRGREKEEQAKRNCGKMHWMLLCNKKQSKIAYCSCHSMATGTNPLWIAYSRFLRAFRVNPVYLSVFVCVFRFVLFDWCITTHLPELQMSLTRMS